MLQYKIKNLPLDMNFVNDVKQMFDEFDEFDELFLGIFGTALDLKKYLDEHKLEKNLVYFARINNEDVIILSEIEKFTLLTTILKLSEYARKNFELVCKWDKIIVMKMMKNNQSYIFYKNMESDWEKFLTIDNIFKYLSTSKSGKHVKKQSNEEDTSDEN